MGLLNDIVRYLLSEVASCLHSLANCTCANVMFMCNVNNAFKGWSEDFS